MSATETVLCLRSCAANMTSYGGFVWPREGHVAAPDWDPVPRCGGGLHGLLWGEGDGGYVDWSEDAVWVVFEADAATVVDLGGKVKVPAATVLMAGERVVVAAWLSERAKGHAVVSGTATAGFGGTATAGDSGTATAGVEGCVAICRWNGKRYRWTLGEIGETPDASGTPLVAGKPYRLDSEGRFVRADQ